MNVFMFDFDTNDSNMQIHSLSFIIWSMMAGKKFYTYLYLHVDLCMLAQLPLWQAERTVWW